MARGGKREGAGRKRKKAYDMTGWKGTCPIEYLLSVVDDTDAKPSDRTDAAKAVAPYIYPRLSAVQAEISGNVKLIHKIETSIVDPQTTDS